MTLDDLLEAMRQYLLDAGSPTPRAKDAFETAAELALYDPQRHR